MFLASENYVCEICGNPAEIAHHKIYLNSRNIQNPEISLNQDMLQAVCIECHNRLHGQGGAVCRGLEFDDNGDIKKRGTI